MKEEIKIDQTIINLNFFKGLPKCKIIGGSLFWGDLFRPEQLLLHYWHRILKKTARKGKLTEEQVHEDKAWFSLNRN